jgi:hypothetical protein
MSAFAGNPVLISLEVLVREGWAALERIKNTSHENWASSYHAHRTRRADAAIHFN